MNNNELRILRILLNNKKRTPFSLCNPNILLCTHNIKNGFWKNGESDILAIDKNFHIWEGEIKISIEDFRKDFQKNIAIVTERKQYLYAKYYILPKNIYIKNEKEIFDKIVDFNRNNFVVGLMTIDGNEIDHIYGSYISDYRIDLIQFMKLVKLCCFRQVNAIDDLIYLNTDIELFK